MKEIETMCQSWQSLEEQKAQKVVNLAVKEDQILKLNAEVRHPLPSSNPLTSVENKVCSEMQYVSKAANDSQ